MIIEKAVSDKWLEFLRPAELPKLVPAFKPDLPASQDNIPINARNINDQDALSKLDWWMENNRVRRGYRKRLQTSGKQYWLVPCLMCNAEVDIKYLAILYRKVNIGARFSVPHTNPFAPGRTDWRSECADNYVTRKEYLVSKTRTVFQFCVPIIKPKDFHTMLALLVGTRLTKLIRSTEVFPYYPDTFVRLESIDYFERLISFALPHAISILNPGRSESCSDYKFYDCKMGTCHYSLAYIPIMDIFDFDPRDSKELHWFVNLVNGSVTGDIVYSNLTKFLLFLERNKII